MLSVLIISNFRAGLSQFADVRRVDRDQCWEVGPRSDRAGAGGQSASADGRAFSAAELLYALQWCEELDSPPAALAGFCEMLEKMDITYENLCRLGNTSGLLHLLFNR